MSDNKDILIENLTKLNFTTDEAKVYLELLREPLTHLRLSVITGINRTKVYRLIENLEKKSLVVRRTDDRGTFLVAADPSSLESNLLTQEEKVKKQRSLFTQVLPNLESLVEKGDDSAFVVRTYEGIEGLKQMCWHELKARGELLGLGGQTIEDLILNHYWAEKHRALSVDSGYRVREIINSDIDYPTITDNKVYMSRYSCRQLASDSIYFNENVTIYNDTVAVYHWRENKKVGVEIESKTYANMMRKIFEYYWSIAKAMRKD